MNLAKVSANGQVTIPVEIRRRLQLKEGDKILFIERKGEIVITNASATIIAQAQDVFAGAANEFDVKSKKSTDDTRHGSDK